MSTEMTTRGKKGWKVPASKMAQNTFNPIRALVDTMKLEPNPNKPMIALSIGDPTVFGNISTPESCERSVFTAIKSMKYNGYAPSVGYKESRQAVADYVSTPTSKVTAEDVILASGCSGALDLCISGIADPGQNILIPRPGFSLYKTLADSLGIHTKHYDLLPEQSWEVDLEHLESLIDDKTAAIVVCNPSNPCGSVFSADHMLAILAVAERYKVPIIADEVYDRFVFEGNEYFSMASLSKHVPILSCGGLTKRFIVPGWRMGWIVVHDNDGVFADLRTGLTQLSQRILGPNTLIQAAMPEILSTTPPSFFSDTVHYLQDNARTFFSHLTVIEGLRPIMPKGAMYMMIGIEMEHFPEFSSDVDFTERMVTEQSVFCLPATCFQYPGFFRVVLTVPKEKVEESCQRIKEFCQTYYQPVVDPTQIEEKLCSHSKVNNGNHSNNNNNNLMNGHQAHTVMVANGHK